MSFVAGSKYEVTMFVAWLMPERPLPCARAEAAVKSNTAERNVFCLLFIKLCLVTGVHEKRSYTARRGWIKIVLLNFLVDIVAAGAPYP